VKLGRLERRKKMEPKIIEEAKGKILRGEGMGGYGLHIRIEGESLVGYAGEERLGVLRPWEKERDLKAVPFIVHLETGWQSGGYRQGLSQYVREAAFVLVDGWPKGRPRPDCSVCGGRGERVRYLWGDTKGPDGTVPCVGTEMVPCSCKN